MSASHHQSSMAVALKAHSRAAIRFFGLLALVTFSAAEASAQISRPGELQPIRRLVVNGQVSLNNDRPAPRVRVKLSSSNGITREALTSDSGRYEFMEVPPGVYYLTATSLTDPTLISDSVGIDTSQSVTGIMIVNLTFRSVTTTPVDSKNKPGVISVAEADQKVPRDARKAFRQGLTFKSSAQAAKALENFNHAIELYPEYFQALAERGDLYISMRELKKGAADFDRALKLNARYEPALRGAGYCKLEGGEFEEAARYLAQAATADPGNANTQLLLGIANLELDRREPARQALQQALKIDAGRAVRAHIHLANLYAREHQYKQAADELHLYLEAAPSDPSADELRKVEAQWRSRPQGE